MPVMMTELITALDFHYRHCVCAVERARRVFAAGNSEKMRWITMQVGSVFTANKPVCMSRV